jgi:hypothetical protein
VSVDGDCDPVVFNPRTQATTRADAVFDPKVDHNRFRRKRFGLFTDQLKHRFAGATRIRLLDIGGSKAYWQGVEDLWRDFPLHITIVNLEAPAIDDGPYTLRPGDACALPEYADNSFDVVHSNSVIEHVGDWARMALMAAEVRRLAPHHFVQTPYFGFPLEPHFRTLFFHWYPEIVRAQMLMSKKRGFRGPMSTLDAAMRSVQSVQLLGVRQMAELFPHSRIERERVYGLTKSIMAIS